MKQVLIMLFILLPALLFPTTTSANSALDQIIYDRSTYQFSDLLQLLAPDQDQDANDFVEKLPMIPTRITWKALNEDGSNYFNHPAQYGTFELSSASPERKDRGIYINDFSPIIMIYPQKEDHPPRIRLGIDYFYSYFTTPSTPFEEPQKTTSQLLIHYLKKQNITFEILVTPPQKSSYYFEGPTLLKISFPNKKDIWLSMTSQLTNRAHITDINIFYEKPADNYGGIK